MKKIDYVMILLGIFVLCSICTEISYVNNKPRKKEKVIKTKIMRSSPAPKIKTINFKVGRSHSGSYIPNSDKLNINE